MAAASKLILFCCLWWIGGAGLSAAEPPSTNAAAEKRGRIVVLGDSITAGYGLSPAQAYPALLQRKIDAAGLPYEVSNAGVSGDTTAGGARRVDWALRGGAEVLIVALGGNDGLRGVQPTETAANLRALVERAREKAPEVRVLICGMEMPANFGAEYLAAFRAVFPTVATETGAELVPFLLERVGGIAELNQPDQIHPNAQGQQLVAENVWRVLSRMLRSR
jgi:acyl-CoA thioesterase-1